MTLSDHLGIQHTEISSSTVILTLPITEQIMQPYGAVHGGVNAVLAEEAASLGALQNLDNDHVAVGVNMHVQHLRAATSGTLVATAIPQHIGGTLQTWEVRIVNETDGGGMSGTSHVSRFQTALAIVTLMAKEVRRAQGTRTQTEE